MLGRRRRGGPEICGYHGVRLTSNTLSLLPIVPWVPRTLGASATYVWRLPDPRRMQGRHEMLM